MQKRTLGNSQRELPTIGLGCMGLSEFYGPPTEQIAAIKLLHEAIELGVEHFDTAEMYGLRSANESLLGEAFEDRRDRIFIATKFGPIRDLETGEFTGINGSRENCRRAVEGSLQRLRTDVIDLYYLHRVDPTIPIEETVAAMAELVAEGKVRAIGLSEASGDTIRRAAEIHPISAVQSEYSIFSRDIEAEVIPACLEVGASLVAYSPLGRGMLSGRFKTETLREGDYRSMTPRYQGEAYAANVALVDEIEAVASTKSCTPAQVALAWVIGRGEHVMTIPGTTKLENLKSNLGAYEVQLSDDEQATLDALADRVMGDRYDEGGMAIING
ncbi:aldo/keto reductase [candidate division CSSED10-310 bacterium]|uniref:Aldo/keto reductase n=1 Tax=candidate division CSSED10-310 bacterium TaxID=2855610 RepID=A0ABV6Z6P5_UNCC1